MLSSFLAIVALGGLGFAATGNEYRPACEAVEAAISKASNLYYPGNSGDCCFHQSELTCVQAIHYTPKESTIMSPPVKKILHV